jgi:hypothetical protein
MGVVRMSQKKVRDELEQVESNIADVLVRITYLATYREYPTRQFVLARIERGLKTQWLTLRRLHRRRQTLQKLLLEEI